MHSGESRGDPSNRRFYEHGIWYLSDTARTRTRDLFRPKRKPIPLGHSDVLLSTGQLTIKSWSSSSFGCDKICFGCSMLRLGCGMIRSGCGIVWSFCGMIICLGCGMICSDCGMICLGCGQICSGCGMICSGCSIMCLGCGQICSGCGTHTIYALIQAIYKATN